MQQKKYVLALILALFVVGIYIIYYNESPVETPNFEFTKSLHKNICEKMFSAPPFDKFQMSSKFSELGPVHEAAANAQRVNGKFQEGFSSQVPEEIIALHYLAQSKFVRTICETGFNYGHSSFNFLTANPQAIVHSFDLGVHPYAKVMAGKLAEMFPGRINVHFGDSTVTIPKFIKENPGFKCDLIFVDGGHVFPVAMADLMNFGRIASRPNNFIVFDDYPTDWGRDFGRAWEVLVQNNTIHEYFRCTAMKNDGLQRGFVAGKVI